MKIKLSIELEITKAKRKAAPSKPRREPQMQISNVIITQQQQKRKS